MHRLVFLHFIALLLIISGNLNAQWSDAFDDGDLTQNPEWKGQTNHFTITPQQELRLQAPDAGTSQLYTTVQLPDSAVWELYFRLEFSPSTSNLFRYYLLADSTALDKGSSIYVEVGESGTVDALRLYAQPASGPRILLASGTPGVLGGATASGTLRVTRLTNGDWILDADYTQTGIFSREALVNHPFWLTGTTYAGIHTVYSATRKDLFYFDNIRAQPYTPDKDPPVLVNVSVTDSATLLIQCSEPLAPNSIVSGTVLLEPFRSIGALTPIPGSPSQVKVSLTQSLVSGVVYELQAGGWTDLSGNPMSISLFPVKWLRPREVQPFEIIFSEIMADPNLPSGGTLGLPDVEYLELYNRTQDTLNLKGLLIKDNISSFSLPEYFLAPEGYVLLYDGRTSAYATNPNAIGLNGFLSLGNTSDAIQLLGKNGSLLDAIAYTTAWYQDTERDDGGWSLELVNVQAPCIGQNNWRASESLKGGTPGENNSVANNQMDGDGPVMVRAIPQDEFNVTVFFNEIPGPKSLDPAGWVITQNQVLEVQLIPETKSVAIRLEKPLQTGIIYKLTAQPPVSDCLGNVLDASSLEFGLPEKVKPGDVVINEIMVNPATGGKRYVEIYNRSAKIFNVKDWLWARRNEEGRAEQYEAVPEDLLLLPDAYLVFTEDTLQLCQRFRCLVSGVKISMDLPTWESDTGTVVLFADGIVADELTYAESWHYPLLKNTDGVALERLDPQIPTQSKFNWYSAAASAGYGTPGYQNSQYRQTSSGSNVPSIALSTPSLSPDGDGYQDIVQLIAGSEVVGYSITAMVFDLEGRPVKTIVSNETIGGNQSWFWDGTDADERPSPLGFYVFKVELIHPDGEHLKRLLPVTLVRK